MLQKFRHAACISSPSAEEIRVGIPLLKRRFQLHVCIVGLLANFIDLYSVTKLFNVLKFK